MKRFVINLIFITTALSASSSFFSCSQNKKIDNIQIDSTKILVEMEQKLMAEPEFEIETSVGTICIRLYDKTPKHRDNFVKLVSEKYYDGMRFHRVIEGFIIQTGDPYSKDTALVNQWGYGGPQYTIPAEFVKEYRHKKGAIAAARKGDLANPMKASSGSQFYIVHSEEGCNHLDGQYTIFGEVIDGMEIVDRIAATPTGQHSRPYNDIMINSIHPIGPSCPIDGMKEDGNQTEN